MKWQKLKRFFLVSLLAIPLSALAGAHNALEQYLKLEEPYLAEPFSEPFELVRTESHRLHRVTAYEFILTSGAWPKPETGETGKFWKHSLTVYRPDGVHHDTALLFVNGGTLYHNPLKYNPAAATLDFVGLAEATHSIVIDLQDIPNQFLTFKDGVRRKEDGIVAYSWQQFLDHPSETTWPVHLPMTKAIISAMDAAQAITMDKWDLPLKHFVVAGVSKRGWVTWLAALSDNRISGIIPIAIDILNTKVNLQHIYQRLDHHWPPAFRDYENARITDRIDSPAFERLMQIEDPLQYLKGPGKAHYKKRLSIPKYLITASGDDFFAPDSMTLYLDSLPGETRLRVLPNQSHAVDLPLASEAILVWYKAILDNTDRPDIYWSPSPLDHSHIVTTTAKPVAITLWQAKNPKNCDFRLHAGIHYMAQKVNGTCFANGHCQYAVNLGKAPASGCQASFVEAEFALQGQRRHFTVTTPVKVTASTGA